ncbi:MAG TPA: integrase core domain-containing protein [Haploplasma sp.]|nr:integrase core domain-containing protein [Haploplasma sp.]
METILHSYQGLIYTSQAFNAQFDNTTIVRSMSRAGKPTDNPIIESFNGWMKNELEYDFKYKDKDDVYQVIEEYINYHNNIRLSYALEYKNPHQYKTDMGYA